MTSRRWYKQWPPLIFIVRKPRNKSSSFFAVACEFLTQEHRPWDYSNEKFFFSSNEWRWIEIFENEMFDLADDNNDEKGRKLPTVSRGNSRYFHVLNLPRFCHRYHANDTLFSHVLLPLRVSDLSFFSRVSAGFFSRVLHVHAGHCHGLSWFRCLLF